jgi:hypothetical protein
VIMRWWEKGEGGEGKDSSGKENKEQVIMIM